jgi:hypothetical protein
MHIGFRTVLAAAAVSASLATGLTSASARGPYDGPWTVNLSPTRGGCSDSFYFGVQVANGRIHASGGGFALAGRVSNGGAVRASISSQAGTAHASGRLGGRSGRGTWVAPSRGCQGVWSATRN